MKSDLLIIDGRHLLWRSSDAFSDLCVTIGSNEIATGGMFGFLSVLMRIYEKHGGGRVAIAWEGRKNFRHKLYPEYKRRDPLDEEKLLLREEIEEQERRLKAILRAVGVNQYYGINCEADDVIGRLACAVDSLDRRALIYSGDSDLRQLVNDNIYVLAPGFRGQETIYDAKRVEEKHGVPPSKIADLKALAGDSSDNIPGVKGVGEKTAAKLLNYFEDMNEIVSAAKGEGFWAETFWPVPMRFKRMIADSESALKTFKALTTIKTSAQIGLIKGRRDQALVIRHLMAYRFRSLMAPVELRQLMSMGVKNEKKEQG